MVGQDFRCCVSGCSMHCRGKESSPMKTRWSIARKENPTQVCDTRFVKRQTGTLALDREDSFQNCQPLHQHVHKVSDLLCRDLANQPHLKCVRTFLTDKQQFPMTY